MKTEILALTSSITGCEAFDKIYNRPDLEQLVCDKFATNMTVLWNELVATEMGYDKETV